MKNVRRLNVPASHPRSGAGWGILGIGAMVLVLIFTACPHQVPPTKSDGVVECSPGYHVCGEDSTECCSSHEFFWEIDTIGGYGSYLKDVAIINENNVWAVGEINMGYDTTVANGDTFAFPITYNAAHWNGSEWELVDIEEAATPLEGIFAFSKDDIWVASGIPAHWDGEKWTLYHLWNMGVLDENDGGVPHIWGTSSSNLYFVGRKGTIVHYDGTSFTKMNSGTEWMILDIWGAWNEKTEEWEILAVASDYFQGRGKNLLRIQGTTVTALPDSGLSWSLSGLWFIPGKQYYIVGAGIHQKQSLQEPIWRVYAPGEVTTYHSSEVRGQGLNDVFVVGSFLEMVHFNGSTWYSYHQEIPYGSGTLGSVEIRGNLVVAVGSVDNKAIALIGRRYLFNIIER